MCPPFFMYKILKINTALFAVGNAPLRQIRFIKNLNFCVGEVPVPSRFMANLIFYIVNLYRMADTPS